MICIHGGKQWSGHAKVHLKNVHEDGVKLLQAIRPFSIRLTDNKMHKGKVCKSYNTIASREMLSTSPEQATNIRKNKITFGHECIDVSMGKSSGDDLSKNNVLILIAKNSYWYI